MKKKLSKSPIVLIIVHAQNWQPIAVCQIKSYPTQPLWQPWRHAIELTCFQECSQLTASPFRIAATLKPSLCSPPTAPGRGSSMVGYQKGLFLPSSIPWKAIFVLHSPSAGQGFLGTSLRSEVLPPQCSCLSLPGIRPTLQAKALPAFSNSLAPVSCLGIFSYKSMWLLTWLYVCWTRTAAQWLLTYHSQKDRSD